MQPNYTKNYIEEKHNTYVSEDSIQINHRLNTEFCQSPRSKTNKTLTEIISRYRQLIQYAALKRLGKMDSRKRVQIIYVNNSLLETHQWYSRIQFKDFQHLKTVIVSSKSDTYTSMDPLINEYVRELNGTDYYTKTPDVIIMCSHPKRINDGIKLLKTLYNYRTRIRFDISFDEADKQLSCISNFLKNLNFNYNGHNISCMVDDMTYITATPFKKFWKMLGANDIFELNNMNYGEEIDYNKVMGKYRYALNNKWFYHENLTTNPLKFIDEIFTQTNFINSRRPHTIFAPSHRYINKKDVGCHMDTMRYFLRKDYVVLLLNGEYKGFKYNGYEISIKAYKQKYNIGGELRDVLRHWRTMNATKNLAITGNDCINRGITFNTNGFNIDYSILSMYHFRNPEDFIQFLGRSSGDKRYCEKSIIIAPKTLHLNAKQILNNYKDIISTNPKCLNSSDFDTKNKVKGKTIPVKVIFLENTHTQLLSIIKNNKGKKRKKKIHTFLTTNIQSGRIQLIDHNNIYTFKIAEKKLNTIRLHDERGLIKKATIGKARRFESFNEAHSERKCYTQKCSLDGYCIDLTVDDFKDNDGSLINKKEIGWITFKKPTI